MERGGQLERVGRGIAQLGADRGGEVLDVGEAHDLRRTRSDRLRERPKRVDHELRDELVLGVVLARFRAAVAASRSSSASVAPRATEPAIGCEYACRPDLRTSSSGEAPANAVPSAPVIRYVKHDG